MQANETDHFEDELAGSRFLLFKLGGELYGSPLSLIREVLRQSDVKSVPYMKDYFKGVINVRGQIVSVVDLRQKFGVPTDDKNQTMLLVVESNENRIAAIVDEVVAVAIVPSEKIDRKPALSTKIPTDFFLGVGSWNERLVNLIDVAGSLSLDDFSTIQRLKEAQ